MVDIVTDKDPSTIEYVCNFQTTINYISLVFYMIDLSATISRLAFFQKEKVTLLAGGHEYEEAR